MSKICTVCNREVETNPCPYCGGEALDKELIERMLKKNRTDLWTDEKSETTAPTVQPQYAPPVQPQYSQPVQPQFVPPVQPQYNQPVQPQYSQPAQQFSQPTQNYTSQTGSEIWSNTNGHPDTLPHPETVSPLAAEVPKTSQKAVKDVEKLGKASSILAIISTSVLALVLIILLLLFATGTIGFKNSSSIKSENEKPVSAQGTLKTGDKDDLTNQDFIYKTENGGKIELEKNHCITITEKGYQYSDYTTGQSNSGEDKLTTPKNIKPGCSLDDFLNAYGLDKDNAMWESYNQSKNTYKYYDLKSDDRKSDEKAYLYFAWYKTSDGEWYKADTDTLKAFDDQTLTPQFSEVLMANVYFDKDGKNTSISFFYVDSNVFRQMNASSTQSNSNSNQNGNSSGAESYEDYFKNYFNN